MRPQTVNRAKIHESKTWTAIVAEITITAFCQGLWLEHKAYRKLRLSQQAIKFRPHIATWNSLHKQEFHVG